MTSTNLPAVSTHLPPQNLEAEEAILGAMLTSSRAIDAAVDEGLRAADFYRPSHRIIFDTVVRLSERGNIDELTVHNELQHLGKLDEIGGKAALFALAERVPSVANARSYAREVRNQATLRQLVDAGHQIARLGYEHPEDPERLVDMAGQLVSDLAQQRDTSDFFEAADLVGDIFNEISERAEAGGKPKGLPTGFTDLDRKTGGFHPSQLIIIAARPAMGKTSFALNIAEHVALREKKPVAIFSLEMDKVDLVIRIMCSIAQVDQKRIRVGVPHDMDWPLLVDASGRINQARGRLFIDDSSSMSPIELRTKARRVHNRLRDVGGLGLIVIDYMQLMEPGRRVENRQVEISYISRSLKALARELRVPVIALSQLSRALEGRVDKRPMLSDLRESGAIEQDADMVLFLHRPEYFDKDKPELAGLAEVIISKNRNGEVGSVNVGFRAKYTQFVNLAHAGDEPPAVLPGSPSPGLRAVQSSGQQDPPIA